MLNRIRWEPPKSTNITSKIQKKKKCESIQDEMNTIQCEVIVKSNTIITFCLLDTGALGGNYISTEIGNLLEREDAFKCKSKRRRIEGAIKGTYEETTKECKVSIRFVNEVSKVNKTIHFIAAIIHTNIPIIIGRKTIKREQLVNKLPSQFIEYLYQDENPYQDENTYQLKAGEKGEIDHLPSQLSRPEPAMMKGEFESLMEINENENEFPWQELINENKMMKSDSLTSKRIQVNWNNSNRLKILEGTCKMRKKIIMMRRKKIYLQWIPSMNGWHL